MNLVPAFEAAAAAAAAAVAANDDLEMLTPKKDPRAKLVPSSPFWNNLSPIMPHSMLRADFDSLSPSNLANLSLQHSPGPWPDQSLVSSQMVSSASQVNLFGGRSYGPSRGGTLITLGGLGKHSPSQPSTSTAIPSSKPFTQKFGGLSGLNNRDGVRERDSSYEPVDRDGSQKQRWRQLVSAAMDNSGREIGKESGILRGFSHHPHAGSVLEASGDEQQFDERQCHTPLFQSARNRESTIAEMDDLDTSLSSVELMETPNRGSNFSGFTTPSSISMNVSSDSPLSPRFHRSRDSVRPSGGSHGKDTLLLQSHGGIDDQVLATVRGYSRQFEFSPFRKTHPGASDLLELPPAPYVLKRRKTPKDSNNFDGLHGDFAVASFDSDSFVHQVDSPRKIINEPRPRTGTSERATADAADFKERVLKLESPVSKVSSLVPKSGQGLKRRRGGIVSITRDSRVPPQEAELVSPSPLRPMAGGGGGDSLVSRQASNDRQSVDSDESAEVSLDEAELVTPGQPTKVLPRRRLVSSVGSERSISGDVKVKNCNCKRSRCLKLYCECFARGDFCKDCNCVDCANTPDKAHQEVRDKAIQITLERDSNAFFRGHVSPSPTSPKASISSGCSHAVSPSSPSENSVRVQKGCHCKKSGCQKKYCECFQLNIACSGACKCVDCKNAKVESLTSRDRKSVKKSVKKPGLTSPSGVAQSPVVAEKD